MVTCVTCGAPLKDEARFCSRCGSGVVANGAGRRRRWVPLAAALAMVVAAGGWWFVSAPKGGPAFAPLTVDIDPATWGPATSWDGGRPAFESHDFRSYGMTYTHAYGNDHGCFSYSFSAANRPAAAVAISARLSSNVPFYGPAPERPSIVAVRIDRHDLGELQVIGDDGSGAPYSWHADPSFFQSGTNELSICVDPDAASANGLAIYYQELGTDNVVPITIREGR